MRSGVLVSRPRDWRVLPTAVGLASLVLLSATWIGRMRHDGTGDPGLASEPAILAGRPAGSSIGIPMGISVHRWDRDPAVAVLDFPDLDRQGAMLDRVAALVEKAGLPRDRVLDDRELARAIAGAGATAATYYYGHDYAAADLRHFFALVDRDRVRLNPQELWLRRLVRRLGWLAGGRGALVSIPAATGPVSPRMRAAILHHELSHGAFFTLGPYEDWSRQFWQRSLTSAERQGFRGWLAGEGYDPALEPLMLDEAQAYLVWTPDPAFFRPELVGLTPARAAALRAAFLAGLPAANRIEDPVPPP